MRRFAGLKAAVLGIPWLLTIALLAPGALAREVLEDEWMLIRMGGQPAGRVHSTVTSEGEVVTSEVHTVMELERFGVAIRQEVTQTMRETADGRPLGFTLRQKIAAQDVEIRGEFRGGKLHLVSRTMGQERTRTEDWPDDAVFGYAMEKLVRSRVKRSGTTFTLKTYSAELDRFIEITYEVGETEEIEVLGTKVRATRSRIKGLFPGVVPTEWRAPDGVVWKLEMGVMGLPIEMLRATREKALEGEGAGATFDVLFDLCVRVGVRLARPREVSGALYRLRLKDGRMEEVSLEGPGQKVERTEPDGAVLLRVRAVRPGPERVLPHPIRDPDMKKYLDPSTFVQSDDPEIEKVARETASRVRSSLAAARRLELWVFRNLTKKGFDRGFASAKEVMRDRAGDCSEHAVLLCALLRAAGIPSRGASGLLYCELPSGENVFAYHMWTEGYVGEWVPLDATLAGKFVDAAHIRLAEADLAGMSPAAGIDALLRVFGRLEIEIVEYAVGDRVVRPAEAGPVSVVERRYRDRAYGISFAVPEGWDVLRAGDPRIVEKGALACLTRKGGEERIALFARDVAPGAILSEVVERETARFEVKERTAARLGGHPALRLTYKKEGRERQAVAAKREGTLYLLRLEPPSAEGRKALETVADSFEFE